MGSFIKKDILLFLRDRKEVVIALLLPLVLIFIFNFAFAGLIDDDEIELDLQLGLVNKDQSVAVKDELTEKLIEDGDFQPEEATVIAEQALDFEPAEIIKNSLENEGMDQWMTVHPLNEEQAKEQVTSEEIDAMLVIPEQFTVESLYAGITGKSPDVSLEYRLTEETMSNGAIYTIITGIIDHLNYQFVIGQVADDNAVELIEPKGGVERLGAGEDFTIAQYYTIAMGILFALFLSMTVASKTSEEIRLHAFDRILITNSHPILFLMGKMVSTFLLAWLQMMLVFALANVLLDVFPDRSWAFWLGMMLVTAFFALAVAGIAAFFTSISLRITNLEAAHGVLNLVIMVFALLGGNFVPRFVFPGFLQKMSDWTPNGRTLSILTDWLQYQQWSSLIIPSIILTSFGIIMTLIGLVIYPKRGRES
ncbi:ABC transporter permease [Gracilibacillus sp. S3-1-1]|uniref:ABC transporter permease n=1 Tax=Gracilibacillus pellucidus TaxID=3095368 RepID=A0ACC6M3R5_9BACI|nr:ABC transporter permease [Gracilibacillus sp. S3-1-1]MDX8045599.1 ABC transporter permease [Gracilibacillus sp. S3-1-1]